ncbi:MAG: hypothetical protein EXS67_03490 [Candidatus Margulisbacteria bacterium]|nr:hypothetical protein [Candidatus Margulisiibacteriota bacterium]
MLKIIASPHIKLDSQNWCFSLSIYFLLNHFPDVNEIEALHQAHQVAILTNNYLPLTYQKIQKITERRSQEFTLSNPRTDELHTLLKTYLTQEESTLGYLIIFRFPERQSSHCIAIHPTDNLLFNTAKAQLDTPEELLRKFTARDPSLCTPFTNEYDIANYIYTQCKDPTLETPPLSIQVIKYEKSLFEEISINVYTRFQFITS